MSRQAYKHLDWGEYTREIDRIEGNIRTTFPIKEQQEEIFRRASVRDSRNKQTIAYWMRVEYENACQNPDRYFSDPRWVS